MSDFVILLLPLLGQAEPVVSRGSFTKGLTRFYKIFKATAIRADAFYKSKCPSMCLFLCSLLRYCLNVFLPPLPKVGYPKFLEIQNSWGKVMERSGLNKHPEVISRIFLVSVLLSAPVERCFVSRMQDFH